MRTTIFSSRYNAKGYNFLQDQWVIGNFDDLSNNPNIDKNSISINENLWNDFRILFSNLIQMHASHYARINNDPVLGIALIGNVQCWNGSFINGKLMMLDDLFDIQASQIKLSLSNNLLEIECSYLDNSDYIYMFFITESIFNELQYTYNYKSINQMTTDDFEYIYYNSLPIRLTYKFIYDNSISYLL